MPMVYTTRHDTSLSERAISHRIQLVQAYVTGPKLKIGHLVEKKNSQQYYRHVSYSVSVNKFVNMYLRHIRWSKLFLMILCVCMCVWDLDNESQCILLFSFPSLSNLKSIPKAGNISNDSAPLLVEYPKAL